MKSRTVVSREYKLMLRPEKFEPSEIPQNGVRSFWNWLTTVAKDVGAASDDALTEVAQRRQVQFYDTEDCFLRKNGYVLRERRKLKDGKASTKRQFTLKYRHPDRFISQARRMKPARSAKGEPKFEEDIKGLFGKPYMASLYSFSSKIEIKQRLANLTDPVSYFGDLGEHLGKFDPKTTLVSVGDFAARELVLVGGFLALDKITAECALIIWHDAAHKTASTPEAVEFSFRYGSEAGEFPGRSVELAFCVFRALQKRASDDGWVDPGSKTKTAFVYHRARKKRNLDTEEVD